MSEKLLLHTCCAPCGIAVIDELRAVYDLSVLFYNPNIYPEAEYLLRKKEVVRVCTEWSVPMIDQDYLPESWNERVKGLEAEPEQGKRCYACIGMRLSHTAKEALERGFPIFGTTLTMGFRKSSKVIFPIGEAAAKRYGIVFYAEDWKKKGRESIARAMVKERGIYRQNYCGCQYSIRDTSLGGSTSK
ncbi:MAG: epoxyqueuosine reductase QueH [Candidatus Moraniibacteriota bacterium]